MAVRREVARTLTAAFVGGAIVYLLTRKKKHGLGVDRPPQPSPQPSGPPGPESEGVVVETGTEGSCQWWLRTKDLRFGYWVTWGTNDFQGTPNDQYDTLGDARAELGDVLAMLASEGKC